MHLWLRGGGRGCQCVSLRAARAAGGLVVTLEVPSRCRPAAASTLLPRTGVHCERRAASGGRRGGRSQKYSAAAAVPRHWQYVRPVARPRRRSAPLAATAPRGY